MKIHTVTMTGADDSINPLDLYRISQTYPYVEWGILVSKKSAGRPRFPSYNWLDQLVQLKKANENLFSGYTRNPPSFSCHICGEWVRQLLLGEEEVFIALKQYLDIFDRIQINTHAEPHEINKIKLINILNEFVADDKEIIIQWDNVNGEKLLHPLLEEELDVSVLYDLSHGEGRLPSEWPAPMVFPQDEDEEDDYITTGYAGGLGPGNLQQSLKNIEGVIKNAVNKEPIWIDMETRIRSNNNQLFDLTKVIGCLEIARDYVAIPTSTWLKYVIRETTEEEKQ